MCILRLYARILIPMRNVIQKSGKAISFIIFNIVVVVATLLLCEGASSLVLILQSASFNAPVAERIHTDYDELLGWVNRPNVYIKNMYGPGLDLQINGQGFRSSYNFTPAPPPGQQRIICSGDSFTLGYGVDNYNNWCYLLDSINPNWQTVNMGQGGYGVGQAYLWFKQDSLTLEHNIHLFTFITRDFERMQQTEFLGYGKPLLKIEDNQLVVDNVPVPRRAFFVPWLTQNSETLKQINMVRLLTQFFEPKQTAQANISGNANDNPEKIVAEIINDLQQINHQKNSQLILVYLPTWGDYDPAQAVDTETWRTYIGRLAKERNIVFLDLVAEFRQVPQDQLYMLFLHENEVDFPGAAGHYSVRGNEFVAQHLFNKLTALENLTAPD